MLNFFTNRYRHNTKYSICHKIIVVLIIHSESRDPSFTFPMGLLAPYCVTYEKYVVLMSKSLKWLKRVKIAKIYEKPKKTSKIWLKIA